MANFDAATLKTGVTGMLDSQGGLGDVANNDDESVRRRQELLSLTKGQNENERIFKDFNKDLKETVEMTKLNNQKLAEQGE